MDRLANLRTLLILFSGNPRNLEIHFKSLENQLNGPFSLSSQSYIPRHHRLANRLRTNHEHTL